MAQRVRLSAEDDMPPEHGRKPRGAAEERSTRHPEGRGIPTATRPALHSVLASLLAVVCCVFGSAEPARAVEYVQLWHSMRGKNGTQLREISTAFNATQTNCAVVPVYGGTYLETFQKAITALQKLRAPHMIQIIATGSAAIAPMNKAVYPLWKLMEDTGVALDKDDFFPGLLNYFSDSSGRMSSLPFTIETPVLYYNKDAFRAAGLDPDAPPTTWPEVEAFAKKTQAAGHACGFTTDRPSWVHVENFSAWHNLPFASEANGFGEGSPRLLIASPLHIRHLQQLHDWQATNIFEFHGRSDDILGGDDVSLPKFLNQHCAMYTGSSSQYATIKASTRGFEFGIGKLPYWPDQPGAPRSTLIDGGALWATKGRSAAENRCVAEFISYFSSPPVQAEWHERTGYLPTSKKAYELARAQGFYDTNLGADIAVREMIALPPGDTPQGVRLGNFAEIREIILEELDAVFLGRKSAESALHAAAERGNAVLAVHEAAHSASASSTLYLDGEIGIDELWLALIAGSLLCGILLGFALSRWRAISTRDEITELGFVASIEQTVRPHEPRHDVSFPPKV
jgi:sn-glycerol 3-phosphate transport system substrate-binding protein